ncbi:hypothetical protein ACJMK2_021213 [Sinanodonta woodiana]|uniref:Poly [ADP-ribose] polymerase n=1 Tax=Sinanodonta woodiana TaxID=1069815 RepID=A0ABD3U370_SINWO
MSTGIGTDRNLPNTRAEWRQNDTNNIDNIAFTSQPVKAGETLEISFVNYGYVNIGFRHSDPDDVNGVDRKPLFTETLEKGYLWKHLCLMEDGDHVKVFYGNMDEHQETVLEGNAKDSAGVWVFFEIVHGDVEVKLKPLVENGDITFHSKHGHQIELSHERCSAYLKEGFLSAAVIVEYPLSSEKTFQICTHLLRDKHGPVFFRFGVLTKPPDDMKTFSDLNKKLRAYKADSKPSVIWFGGTVINSETYQGTFHVRWSKTGELTHNITDDCSEVTDSPQVDPPKESWLLLDLHRMEATVYIEDADQLQPDRKNRDKTESRFVLIRGLRNTDNKDELTKRLEIALNRQNPVVKIVYGSSSDKVVVIFNDQVNPEFLKVFLNKKAHLYKIEAIKEPTVVQVLQIPKNQLFLKTVLTYLKNEDISAGTKDADYHGQPDPNSGYCLINLKDPTVVNRVCKKRHSIAGKDVIILPYYDILGIAVNFEDRPDDLISGQLVLNEINEHGLKFILEEMKEELEEFKKAHRIKIVGQSVNSLTFSPNLDDSFNTSDVVIGPEWQIRVEKAFSEELLRQLCVESLKIKDERKWKHLQDKNETLCRGAPTVSLYQNTNDRTFTFVSRKSDETILKSLKATIECEEPPEESVTDNYDEPNLTKLGAFDVLGCKDDIEFKTHVKLRINVEDGKIELIGLKENNQLAMTEIARTLASLECKTCTPPNADYLQILKSTQMTETLNRAIAAKNLRGTWEIVSDGDNQQIVICYEDSHNVTFGQIQQLIFGLVETDVIAIDGEINPESLNALRTQLGQIEESFNPFLQVKLLEDSKHVRITCRKDLMVDCRQKVKNFIKVHIISTSEISMKPSIAEYMHDIMKSQIEKALQDEGVNTQDLKFDDNKFYITGNQNIYINCSKVLNMLASKVIVTWRPIVRRGIHKYFTIGAGKSMESGITNCHMKILGKDDFRNQKIRAIALTEVGQAIIIGGLDPYKQQMDGVVNEMNVDGKQFKKGGEAVEREIDHYISSQGQLTEGEVFVTASGKLPCLKILHAVAPKWRGGTENEDKTLEKTIENILSTAESESLRSIAMPMIAFGYPTKRASGIILQTIIKHCPTRFKSIREIYICDTDSTKIQTFQRLAEDMFGSQYYFIPHGQNLKLGKTIAKTPKKNHREGYQTIVQRRGIRKIPIPDGREIIIAWGDLARLSECTPPLQAEIIVNPTTSFPDIRGVIANSLKKATSNGGLFDLESECKKREPQGGLKTGDYVTTDTPHMSFNEILHLKIEHDWSKINEETLKGYIKSCVNYALLKEKKSVAFPAIGTGNVGYPKDVVAKCFAHSISEFSQAQTSGSLKTFIIVIYDRDSATTMAFEQELQSMLAMRPHRLEATIEEEIMEEEQDKEEEQKKATRSSSSYSDNPSPTSQVQLATYPLQNGCRLTLMHGSLEKSGAAALVSPTSGIPILNGVIPSAIRKASGGTTIVHELQQKYGNGVQEGDIAITGAGNITGASKVYHLKLENYDKQKRSQNFMIYNSVNTCLKQADKDRVSSVAFPTIGTGGFKWPPQLVADETFQAVKSYISSRGSSEPPLHIIIVIFSQNSPEYSVFQTTAKKQFDQHGPSPNKSDYANKATVVSGEKTDIDHEKRDFILLKFLSNTMDKANEAFEIVKKKVDGDFSGHGPLKNDVICKLRSRDIKEIEMICMKFDVEAEVSKQTNEIIFKGTAANVRSANKRILNVLTTLHGCLQNETVGQLVQQYYEWCYEEAKHVLIPYSKAIGIELEIAFTKGYKTYEFTDTDDLKYCVDFKTYNEFQVSRKSNRVNVVRLDRMMGDLQPMPDNWNPKDSVFLDVVPLQKSNYEYLEVEADFKLTLGSYKFKMIHGIKRIQNRTTYQQYALRKKSMQQSPQRLQHNPQPLEMLLWHGTALDKVNTINLNGFNRSYISRTNENDAKYGKGVYFSTHSENECNDNYTVKDSKGHKHMYRCKVLTGNVKHLTQDYSERYPPTDPTTGIKYDSTLSPNKVEYVIYSDTQSYPEYLIEFE